MLIQKKWLWLGKFRQHKQGRWETSPGRSARLTPPPLPSPSLFTGAKRFFPRKIRKQKNFTCEEHIDLSLFIEQEVSDKK